jgi:hypothetical protein
LTVLADASQSPVLTNDLPKVNLANYFRRLVPVGTIVAQRALPGNLMAGLLERNPTVLEVK